MTVLSVPENGQPTLFSLKTEKRNQPGEIRAVFMSRFAQSFKV